MHRTTCTRQSLAWGMLLAFILIAPSTAVRAQFSPGAALIVPINGTVRLQMATKKPIKSVVNPKDTAISIRTVVGDPTTVLITGQTPDVTRIDLIDEDGKKETFEVIVQLDVEYLKTQLKRAVPTANVIPIPTSNNAVILSGTVTKAEDIDIILRVAQSIGGVQVINALRVGGVQQVQLDVGVYEVSRTKFRAMAFNFLADSRNTFFGSTIGQAVSNPVLVGVGSASLNATGLSGGQTLSGLPGSPNGNPTNILAGVLKSGYGFLFFLQAMKDENVVKVLAEPHLTTLSGRPASFLAGGEQAIPVPAGLGQVGVQFEEFGNRLNFLPIVLGNGRIHLEVEPELSALNPANGTSINGTVVPGRDTDRINTTVQLEDGQTFVLGGLTQRRVQGSIEKVPVLGDIPFLNAFFTSKSYQETEDELLIIVTVHLVDGQSCDQVVHTLPGQETRSPDDFELFLEGILEAPRGPREICPGHKYVPAYKNSPTLDQYPCGKDGCGPSCGLNGSGPAGIVPVAAAVASPVPAANGKTTQSPVPMAKETPAPPSAKTPQAPAQAPRGQPAPGAEIAPARPSTLPAAPPAPTAPRRGDAPSAESLLGPGD